MAPNQTAHDQPPRPIEAGKPPRPIEAGNPNDPTLRRVLTTPLLTLYGLGVTIGAGIYVLVGVTAGVAGIYAPVSFLVAAVVVLFVALSYAELAVRMPVSAGEAAYALVLNRRRCRCWSVCWWRRPGLFRRLR